MMGAYDNTSPLHATSQQQQHFNDYASLSSSTVIELPSFSATSNHEDPKPTNAVHHSLSNFSSSNSESSSPSSQFASTNDLSNQVQFSANNEAAKVPKSHFSKLNYEEIFETAILVLSWYITSSFSNNLNKSILESEVFPFPVTLTFVQFFFLLICCLALFQISSSPSMAKTFGTNFKLQSVERKMIPAVLIPLCISQIFAHLLTQISLQQVPVSFTHTVKVTLVHSYNF